MNISELVRRLTRRVFTRRSDAFGNVTAAQERSYEAQRFAWLDRMQRHLLYAWRGILHRPAFSLAIILTLAIGIGFNASIFTVFYSLVYRPLPISGADRLVNVYQLLGGTVQRSVNGAKSYLSYEELTRYRGTLAQLPESERTLEATAAYREVSLAFDEARRKTTNGEYVSCDYFATIGARIVVGRSFTSDECRTHGDTPVAVVSHDTWQNDLGGTLDVVGKSITLNRIRFTVIGVAEPGFGGLMVEKARLWIPITMQPAIDHGRDSVLTRDVSWVVMIGRLAPSATVERARNQLATIAHAIDADHPGRETRVVVTKAAYLNAPEIREQGALTIAVVFVLGALATAIVCANVMGLLLARGLARRREIAIRLAIGASRGRLIEQLLGESVVLALIGGAIGFALAFTLPSIVSRIIPATAPEFQFDLTPDARVLAFTVVVSVLTAFVFGLLPALQSTNFDLVSASKDGAPSAGGRIRTSRLRAAIVGTQVAASALLLIIASLFSRSAASGATIDLGYTTHGVLSVRLNLRALDYDPTRAKAVLRDLTRQAAATPGVQSVGLVTTMPLLGSEGRGIEPAEGSSNGRGMKHFKLTATNGGFFRAMGIRFVAGRAFTDAEIDAGGEPPAVISDAMARRFWPTSPPSEAVGKRIRIDRTQYVISGVAANVRYTEIGDSMEAFAYRALPADLLPDARLIIRARDDQLVSRLERDVPEWASALDPSVSAESERFTSRVDLALLPSRLTAIVAGAIGLLALVLAVIGIYGVVSYAVSQRGREIAIRIALGSSRRGVIALMMRQSTRAGAIGLVVGSVLAMAGAAVARNQLVGVSPHDPATYIAITIVLGGAAAIAAYLPSRRAARVDPARTLRED